MSARTVTLTAPNGAKVRTVRSRRYFVVSFQEVELTWNNETREYDHHEPRPVASVVKRTDSPEVALRELRRNPSNRVVFAVAATDEPGLANNWILSAVDLESRVNSEKSRKAFAARVGRQGEARRLSY